MTDRQLAEAFRDATDLEQAARRQWTSPLDPKAEREAALNVVRLVVPLKQSLEAWITARACRAALQQTGT